MDDGSNTKKQKKTIFRLIPAISTKQGRTVSFGELVDRMGLGQGRWK